MLKKGSTKEGESTLRQKVGDVGAVFLSVYILKGSLSGLEKSIVLGE